MARIRLDVALIASFALGITTTLHGQSVALESEYKKLIRVSEDIQPLGENAFGESISLYDGSVSFIQTDLRSEGRGLPIIVERTIKARPEGGPGAYVFDLAHNAFADWDLSIPRLETLTAEYKGSNGAGSSYAIWYFQDEEQRCSRFYGAGPVTVATKPGSEPVVWEPDTWWHGFQLKIPGEGVQDVLKRDPMNALVPQMYHPDGVAMEFPAVTKKHWMLGCLRQTSNGVPGEAFLAVAPDGTKYWLDRLASRSTSSLSHPGGGALKRREVSMLATRAEDRFGNVLSFSYDTNHNLISIDASDGRKLILAYESWQHSNGFYPIGYRIVSATLRTNAGDRVWKYSYSGDRDEPALIGVMQPDGSGWSFENMVALSASGRRVNYSGCERPGFSGLSTPFTATLRHPSGLIGRFTMQSTIRGRSYVPKRCIFDRGSNYLSVPFAYASPAITQKTYSGAGMSEQVWSFAYSSPNESWAEDCSAGCAASVWTDETDPNGSSIRHVFSNRYDSTESLRLSSHYYSQGIGSQNIRAEIYGYANPFLGPWPVQLGDNMQANVNHSQTETWSPMSQRTLQQDGDSYVWKATGFNEYAQVTQTRRYNNIAGQVEVVQRTSYLNDLPHWVLGLPVQVDNLTTGETESLNTYNLSNVTLQSRARFGQTLMSYTFDGQGQLASFTDGRNNTTTLSNYKRGIPQSIGYPDNTTQSLVVDDFGQISSLTDQAGNTTSYSYDPIGRIAGITYPAGDEVAWSPKTFSYNFVTGAERGIAGGHWRRLTTKGNALTTTYFDAMLRPVLSDTAINGAANSDISVRTDYDWKGQKTFVSYPVSGTPDLSAISSGSTSTYDALGRLTQTQQASELGTLTTTTAYLSGARQQVTDARGYVTTSSYQVFDQPSYNAVIQVQAPEGITQAITRDVYGNPLSIAQSGLYGTQSVAVTKTLTYDSYHRLCRTTEPESGSEVTAYDGANNVAWTAAGLSISGTGCGQEQVADAAKIQRTYDAMNRVQTLQPPAGTQSTSYTYDPLGNLATSTSGISASAITRNKLGLPTVETLSVNGNGANVLRYGHDSNGNLSTLSYPDGTVINYAPDALGRPTQVGSYASGISYFPDGDVQHFTYGNGTDYLVQKNTRQLLSNFTYAKGSTLNLSEDFAYDANGNISTINDLAGGPRSKVLSYDTLNRLTQAQANGLWGTESYSYDPLNNIRSRTSGGQAYAYNYDATNRLASITNGTATTSSFLYDNRGNVTTKNGNTLVFDAKNQLMQIPGFGSYAYDAAGRRVLKTPASGNGSTYYFYNQAGQLLYQFDGATTKTTDYIYLGKKMIARSEGYASNVVGGIDGIDVGAEGNGFVSGWACSSGLTQSINVDLYVGGPVGAGTLIGRYSANRPSEAGVLSACGVTTGSYRFYIPLAAATQSQYAGQGVYVYGISPVGNANGLLAHAGTYVVPAAPSSPAAPATTSATVASDLSSISVSWSASTGATRYTVQQQVNGGAWTTLVNGNTTSTTISNPADGSYVFQAQACNANGCSVWTASSAVKVAHIPPTPASISVPATSNGPVTISWAASPWATYYNLYQGIDGGGWTQIYSGPATTTTITATVSGGYTFHVAAGAPSGWSGQLASSSTVVVTIPPASAPSLTVPSSNNTGSYSVSWGSVSGATSYTLQEQVNGGGWSTVQASNANSWSASGRGNGTYGYRVQACNAGGCGPWGIERSVPVALAPPAPSNVKIVYRVKGKTESYWTEWGAVTGATRYEAMRLDSGALVYSGAATTFLIGTAFIPDIPDFYEPAVRACNANGCSAWVNGSW